MKHPDLGRGRCACERRGDDRTVVPRMLNLGFGNLVPRRAGAFAIAMALTLLPAVCGYEAALAQFSQQGPKLVGTGTLSSAHQGASVAVSANGNTAIVGGPYDGQFAPGAAWVFTRTNGLWSQQQKLIGTNDTLDANQGWSVAMSADGTTAAVGGPLNSSSAGATWVFVLSGTTWTQQAMLNGTGGAADAEQGISVALSGDGNTLLVGGSGNSGGTGATWVFTRSGTTWSQQAMLTGVVDQVGSALFGQSVALSSSRRAQKLPPRQGGWHMFVTGYFGLDFVDPNSRLLHPETLLATADEVIQRSPRWHRRG
jgi:hypothetical protein